MPDPEISASAVILGELRDFRRDHREDLDKVNTRLGAIEVEQGRQQVKLTALDNSLKGAWKRVRAGSRFWERLVSVLDFLVELPALAKVLIVAATLLLTLWGGTHAWLVRGLAQEGYHGVSQPGLQAVRDGVRSNGRN